MREPNYIQASDVEFVDDAALLLSARSPSKLMKAMPKLLSNILSVFQRFSFHVNWAKGKTEAFLSLRGKNAHILMQDVISNESSISVPNSGERLRVVSEYKHLGTVLSEDGSDNLDAVRRVQLSLAAYCPLASKVFGSFSVKICLKLKLADSLVFSRLFYNTHLYARLSKFMMAKLNSVYMRVLRKVLGRPPRFQDRSLNDEQVRAALHMPSVSTLLRMRRLKYLASLVSSDTHMLHSLLACRGTCHDAPVMPWCALIADDLRIMAAQLHHKLGNLGDPLVNAKEWVSVMRDFPQEWKSLVECLHDPPSDVANVDPRPACDLRFVCSLCESNGHRAAFASNKALQSHARVKHGSRSFMKQFIGSDFRCAVCRNQFSTRLRAIAHLSEKRKRGNRTRLCNDVVM